MSKRLTLSYQRTCQSGEAAGALTLESKTSRCRTKMETNVQHGPTPHLLDAIAGNKTSSSKTPPTVQASEEKRMRESVLWRFSHLSFFDWTIH